MNEIFPDIKTTVLRLSTDKPVRKTPYQVKGVFIKKHGSEPITPMLDGTYRKKFSYPRVQVKILNEQIHIIGINEGVEPVLSIPDKIKEAPKKWYNSNFSRKIIIANKALSSGIN